MQIPEKLKAIRKAEGLSQTAFCQLLDMSISSVKKYETGIIEPGGSVLMHILQHQRFQKYTLWVMSGKTAPQAGQIAPALAHIGPESTESDQSGKQTG
ncbi:helix-turn-helix domain-containing protein [Klebsiella aerogenes]|nr:helix-turn-helix transcriptional regulator [Klebsiella aerogenes]ELA0229732.1 helix-turn-helix transcriptional regulator [Klebsiella aerogenes]